MTGRRTIPAHKQLRIDREALVGEDFSRKKLTSMSVHASTLTLCRFDGLHVDAAVFGAGEQMSIYRECSFDGSNIQASTVGFARFEKCSFRNVSLRQWICFAAEFVDCYFSGRAERAVFYGSSPYGEAAVVGRNQNEFRGNDFVEMELIDVAFRGGIDLTRQHLPSGSSYLFLKDARKAVVEARSHVALWSDERQRSKGLAFLKTLMDEIASGQEQLLIHMDDFAGPRAARNELFAVLESAESVNPR